MKCFSLISEPKKISANKKVIPAEEFSLLLSAKEIVDIAEQDATNLKNNLIAQGKKLKASATKNGFQEGLNQWAQQLAFLQQETNAMKERIKKAIIPLVVMSVKKIIGQEMQINPDLIVSMITTSLQAVSQNKRITIFVNPGDLDLVTSSKPHLKKVFEYLEALMVAAKEDIPKGSAIIETETGIINTNLDNQLKALESILKDLLKEPDNAPPMLSSEPSNSPAGAVPPTSSTQSPGAK